MDRNGDDWTGDQIEADAQGKSAGSGGASNRAEARASTEDKAPRPRAVDTAASGSVQPDDGGAAPATTAGSGAAGKGK